MTQDPQVELDGSTLRLSFPYSASSVAAIKSLGHARWDPAGKSWKLPHTESVLGSLKRIFPNIKYGPNLSSGNDAQAESLIEAEERKYLPKAKQLEITDFEFRTSPFWHQKMGFNFMRSLDQSACFFEQGLGKAKLFIDLATWRYREKQVKRALVVCPNSVVGQWVEELRVHGHADFSDYVVLDGPIAKRIKTLESWCRAGKSGFILVNYEALKPMMEYLLKANAKQELFQMMGLDESSKIKHAQAKRSQAAWKIGRTVRYRNILTGTPITQNGEDVFSQYRFLNEKIFGPYATAFRGQYLIMGGFENRQVVGYRNFQEFLKRVYSLAIRFTKDRCLDLPPKVYQKRAARLDPEVSAQYKQFEKECVAKFDGAQISAPMIMTKLMKLSQVTGGFIYEQGADGKRVATHTFAMNPKIDVLEEILEESAGKKIIVWCRFTQELQAIEALLDLMKLPHVAIHGGVSPADRGAAVSRFQTDSSCRVFLGQVSTAGMGITLTAASTVVYYSNTYALEDRLQSEDRCHRIGQKQSVTYVDILAETSDGRRTIDHDVLDVIRGKAAFAQEVSMALMQKMVIRVDNPGPSAKRNPAYLKKHNKNDDAILEDESFEA